MEAPTARSVTDSRDDRHIDHMIAGFALVCLIAGTLLIWDPTNRLFMIIDFVFGVVLSIVYFARRALHQSLKIAFVYASAFMMGVTSLVASGLLGSGVVMFMILQVAVLVYMKASRAIATSLILAGIVALVGLLAARGILDFPIELFSRMNSPVNWTIQALAMVFFAFTSGSVIYDLRSRLAANIQELERIAYIDPLTKLPNRLQFEKVIANHLNAHDNGWLVVLDIRGLRSINALSGKATGDSVVQLCANAITDSSTLRPVVGRVGGGEFGCCFEDVTRQELESWIHELKRRVTNRHPGEALEQRIEFNAAGVAFSAGFSNATELIQAADLALDHAKRNALDTLVFFESALRDSAVGESRMRDLLEKAVIGKSFQVYYQPKARISTREIVGVEALARWNSDELGYIGPDVFVPVLDQTGLMIPFGKVILERVLDDVPRLQARYGETVLISINVSPVFFLTSGFTEYLTKAVEDSAITPDRLVLEITEDVFIDDLSTIQKTIRDLRSEGFRISLDDFGKGYSSLSYISNIEFDELKIDKAFIDRIVDDERSLKLFRSICEIAVCFGYKVVAEGVETEDQIDRLLTTSCEIVQGYYFGRPEPVQG